MCWTRVPGHQAGRNGWAPCRERALGRVLGPLPPLSRLPSTVLSFRALGDPLLSSVALSTHPYEVAFCPSFSEVKRGPGPCHYFEIPLILKKKKREIANRGYKMMLFYMLLMNQIRAQSPQKHNRHRTFQQFVTNVSVCKALQ